MTTTLVVIVICCCVFVVSVLIMSALSGSASRFSVLDDDDAADWVEPRQGKKKKQAAAAAAKVSVEKKSGGSGPQKKNESAELQAMLFGGGAKKSLSQGASKKKKKDKKKAEKDAAGGSMQQFDEWKEKDKQFVDNAFTKDLHEALIQSKVEEEAQRKSDAAVAASIAASAAHSGGISTNGLAVTPGKKQQGAGKPATISLDQFNAMAPEQIAAGGGGRLDANADDEEKSPPPSSSAAAARAAAAKDSSPTSEAETDFFSKIDEATEKALNREHILESFRNHNLFPGETALMAQFKDAMAKKNKKLENAQKENETLKADLLKVKSRNKELCKIIAEAEMKEKAILVNEVQKLRKAQAELSCELTSATILLEQERSKVHELSKKIRQTPAQAGSSRKSGSAE